MALFGISQTSTCSALRHGLRELGRAARPGMGAHHRSAQAPDRSSVPNLMEPALRLVRWFGLEPTAECVPDQRRRLRLGGAPRRAVLAPRPTRRRAPAPRERGARTLVEPARRLGEILSDVHVQLALATLTISQFVMISTTSTSRSTCTTRFTPCRRSAWPSHFDLGGMFVASPLSAGCATASAGFR